MNLHKPDGGAGDQAERLAGMDARAAIDAIEGDFADTLPVLGSTSFPGPVSERFFHSDATVAGIQGPVGSGKTTTLLLSRFRRAMAMPRSVVDGVRHYKLIAVRQTYRQLWSTTIPSYLETYPKAFGDWSGGRGDPVTHRIRFEDEFGVVDWVTEFMAFGDDIVASMRGIQATDMWLNETDTMPPDVLGAGIGRIFRWPAQKHFEGYPPALQRFGQIVCDFNAPDEDNWTHGMFHDQAARERAVADMNRALDPDVPPIAIEFYNQPGYGEPGTENLHNLRPGYYEAQIAANRLAGKGDLTKRLVYNKVTWLRAGEPVFQREFNRRIHVAETALEPWQGVPLRIGLDQGFKGAAIIAQFDTPWRWQVLAELHFPKDRLMAKEFGRRLRELLDRPRFKGLPVLGGWADMAGEHGASAAADENDTWNLLVSKAAGFTVRAQRIGTNRLQPRLEAVRAALEFLHGGTPGLLIDPACRFLISGFEARYVWTDEITPQGDKRKVPDKRLTEANVHDALQYLLLSETLGSGESRVGSGSLSDPAKTRTGGADPAGAGLRTAFDILDPYGA